MGEGVACKLRDALQRLGIRVMVVVDGDDLESTRLDEFVDDVRALKNYLSTAQNPPVKRNRTNIASTSRDYNGLLMFQRLFSEEKKGDEAP